MAFAGEPIDHGKKWTEVLDQKLTVFWNNAASQKTIRAKESLLTVDLWMLVMDSKKIEVLKAGSVYVAGLREIANNAERILQEDDDWDEESSVLLNFSWLSATFEMFWFENTSSEELVRSQIPDCPVFTPLDFERLVQSVLLLVEEKYYRLTGLTGDRGIDLIFEKREDSNWNAYSTTLVQCKLYRGFVPIAEVRDFFGVISANTAKGIFITTGRPTAQTQEFLPLANSSPHSNSMSFLGKTEWYRLLYLARKCNELLCTDRDDENEIAGIFSELQTYRRQAHELIYNQRKPIQEELW